MTPHEEALRRIAHAKAANAALLDLGDLELAEVPKELGELTQLRVLALGKRRPSYDDTGELTWEFERKRPGQPFRHVEPLRHLTGLTELDLSGCKQLSSIAPLGALTGLAALRLHACEPLTSIDALRGLIRLRELYLSECRQLTSIVALRGLTELASLDLRRCNGLTNIDALGGLTGLTALHLRLCGHLGSFEPVRARLPGLTELSLFGSSFGDLPPEVCGDAYEDNVIDKVRAHYADLERGAQADTELKVFVLGNGGVGKSHLCNRLRGGEYPADPSIIPTTHGIQVEEFLLEISGASQAARVNVWDFGGQEIYHGSHALFLRQRAVFLLLWHPDRERGEFREGGVTMRHRPLAYWFDYVRNIAGPHAAVLVVQSQCDSPTRKRPLPAPLPDDFAFVRALAVSAKTGTGMTELRGTLAGAVEELFGKRPPRKIGVGRVAVRRRVREMAPARPTIGVAEFHDLCRANGNISDPDALLDFFHECGVVFYRRGMFDDRIILDQNWALAAIYTLLDRGRTLPALNRHGRFTRTDLQALVWHGKSDADCDTLLGMMRSCDICFKAGEVPLPDGTRQTQYIAPELLPPWSESLVSMFRRLRDDPKHLGFEVRYPFLHDGILRGFLSRLGNLAGDHAVYWKYGCWFHEQSSGCDVFIESGWDKTAEEHSRGGITVRAWGQDPEDVLRSVANLLQDHRMVQKPETHFLNFAGFDRPGETPPEEEGPILVPSPPTGAIPPDNLGKQVYLSYAWGEDSSEIGRRREEAARRVIERLTEAGYDVTYDRRDMRPGDLISDFIHRIGTAQHVVAILSKKYLESPYCIKELHSVFLYSLSKRAHFLSRVHPIALEDAGLRDETAWEGYQAYWKAKKARQEELFPHGSGGAVLSAVDIEHWLLDLTTVLSYLNDVIGPGPHGDLNGMIDAVLKMLERTERGAQSRPGSLKESEA